MKQERSEQLPGLKPLFHLGDGQDVGADLSGNGGQIGVLLLQLHQVMKLGYNQRTNLGQPPEAWPKYGRESLEKGHLRRSPAH